MTITHARRGPATETELLKARYDEARAIKQAWDVRLDTAQRRHSETIRNEGDFEATRRTLDAVEIQVADAAAELKVALNAWMNSCTQSTTTKAVKS